MAKISRIVLCICLLQCINSLTAQGATTYDWTGATSTDWNTPGNWKVGGVTQTTNYPGISSTDIAQIGVASVTISRQPTISNPITIAALTIGTKASSNTLTINAALTISGDFTQKNDGTGVGVTTNLTGSGSISCNNFYAGDSTLPPTPILGITSPTYLTTLNFSSLSLTINQNLYLTTTASKTSLVYLLVAFPAASVNNPIFNFNSGNITIGNSLTTVDSNDANIAAYLLIFPAVSSSAQFLMSPGSGNTATLNLNGANALSLDGNAGYVDFYGTGGGTTTVNYGGSGNQEVYTSTAAYNAAGTRQFANGLDRSPSMYQNLSFSGALTKKADAGNVTVGSNLTLTASGTETVDFATNSPVVTVGGNFTSNSGTTINQGGTGTMTITGSSSNSGALNQTGSGGITFTGALSNGVSGTITQSSTGAITASAGATNSGSITQLSGATGGINITGALTSSGTVTQTGGNIVVNGSVTNSGILTLGTANLNISGDYTNSGVYSQSTGTTLFNGSSAQTMQGGAGNGTPFHNVNFSGAGAKTMTSGAFSVASTSVLTMIGSSTLAANGYLTLKSDSTGSATVAALPTGASITGNVNVQRFMSGGSLSHRSYRLMSSAVNQGSRLYSINYLINSIYLTGTSGIPGGFDKQGNPTLYLYRENLAPLNTSFLNSNYRGIADISASPNYTIDLDGGPYNIPIGNGFLCFFRGDRNAASLATETTTTYVPTYAILTSTGVLNTDTITVKDWYTPTSWNLGFTYTTGNDIVRGFNLVGNPYASSIDWDKFQTTSPTSGIYGSNVDSTIYVLDEITRTYGAYIAGSGGVGSTSYVSNIISSGQGFFVTAKCSCAKLTFTESAKTNTQVTGALLLMGKPEVIASNQYIRLQLMGKDSTVGEQTLIRFKDQAPLKFSAAVDAAYKNGFGAASLSTFSQDMTSLAINTIPLPKQQDEIIKLNVNAINSGVYTMKLRDLVAVPQLYDIWLKDAYKNDSLDMRQNKIYAFNIYKNDSTSFGSKRFTLVLRQNPAYAYHLINFNAQKVAGIIRQVQVSWSVKNEGNYTNFTVERSIDNGKTFSAIGGVKAAGQGTYSFIDNTAVTGANIYRLKQEDINNLITWSKIVTIQYSNFSDSTLGNKINIYPNPVGNQVSLDIASNTSENKIYNIIILNSSGLTVKNILSSEPTWQGSVGNLKPGTYIVQVFNQKTKNLIGENKFVKL